MFVTLSDILSACLSASDFGNTSPKISTSSVTIPVDIPIAVLASHHDTAAMSMLIFAANDAAVMLTMLFPMSIVARSLSFLSLSFLSINAVLFPFLIHEFILCKGMLIKASSVPEKNADPKISKINAIISPEFIYKKNK